MKPRIVFMGTPDFAVPSLEKLVAAGYPVVGVITATDKYGGRGGKQLLQSAVKRAANRLDIPVLQPKNLKAPAFIEELKALRADLQIVVAFRMLPEVVWAMPPLGTFNLHASLLPRYRGAAPISWAVMNGDTETGATTFFLQHRIDTGDMLLQDRLSIGPDETAGEVHDRLMQLGADLVLRTVQHIETGKAKPRQQDHTQATEAPKLFRENCRIDFDRPAREVHNFIRGLSPYPTAWTTLEGQTLKIIRCEVQEIATNEPPATLITDGRKQLKIACRGGYVYPTQLQLAGRRRMSLADFLNGTELKNKTQLGD